jgi:uncharacterized membrane protein YphA (DoxX/SURF4 family)
VTPTLALSVHETPTQKSPVPVAAWSVARRMAFRFLALYLVLYNSDVVIRMGLGTDVLSQAYDRLWEAVVPWVGRRLLHLATEVATATTGSGDRTFDYVQLLCFAAVAWVGTLLWTLLDQRSGDHRRLLAWLRLYVRYSLGVTLLTYGAMKVFKTQFRAPSAARLVEAYGDSSPMGLLWTFMGHSTAYTVFAGSGEVLAALLLFFRRTATVGALLAVAVMTNVVMLNLCYDVPVKQYSAHLLAMALFVVLPALRPLGELLVLHRPAFPELPVPLVTRPRLVVAARVAQGLFIVWAVLRIGYEGWSNMRLWGDAAAVPAYEGVYQVEDLTRALSTAATRWRRLGIDRRLFKVVLADDTILRFRLEPGATADTLTLRDGDTPGRTYPLHYQMPDPTHLVLEGSLRDELVAVRLRKLSASDFLLLHRGFHWVSEVPYNR